MTSSTTEANTGHSVPSSSDVAPLRIGVLLSGSGTNLQAIIDAIDAGRLHASIELVVSSRPSAYGITRAQRAGLPTLSLSKEAYADPIQADRIIAAELKSHNVEYVIMAGYMRMVHEPILSAFPNRVINLHPALLPSFPGAHAIADAYAAGVKVTGVTVHFANEVYDDGSIIAQRPVAVQEGWTEEDLEAAIHDIEHVLYPEAIEMIAQGRIRVCDDGRTQVDGQLTTPAHVEVDGSRFVRHDIRTAGRLAW